MASFTLSAHGLSGARLGSVEVAPGQTLAEVKVSLEGVSKVPARYQQLCHPGASGPRGEVLRDEETVAGAGFRAGAAVCLVARAAQPLDFVEAVRDGACNLEHLRYMAANGADINAKACAADHQPDLDDDLHDARDKYMLSIGLLQASALHHAARHGHQVVCKLLLDDTGFTETNSLTLTGQYDEQRHPEALQLTALHVAALAGHQDVCLLLLRCRRYERVDDSIRLCHDPMPTSPSALAFACMKGLADVVQALLKDPRCTGLDRFVDNYETTLLMLAASRKSRGNLRVCMMIIDDPRFEEMLDASASPHGPVNRLLHGSPSRGTAAEHAGRSGLHEVSRRLEQVSRERSQREESQRMALAGAADAGNTAGTAARPAAAAAAASSSSSLSLSEKDFLKAAKDFRGILRLEERRAAGERLDPLQERKLARRDEVLGELRLAEARLSRSSGLRGRNQDVLAHCP